MVDSLPTPFVIRIRFESGLAIVTPRGEIDVATADQLRSHLDGLRRTGWKSVEVDLREVEFIDASGLGALLRARHDFATVDADLSFSHPSDAVERLLEASAQVGYERASELLAGRFES